MNQQQLFNVLLSPRVTEKTTQVGENSNQYVFKVASDANKSDIKAAVEMLFKVNVENVTVVNVKGKNKAFRFRAGKRKDWKKAYVRVQQGQTIDFLDSESA